MVQTLAAAGELQRDLQREPTDDGLRAAGRRGDSQQKGGRRPAVPAEKTAPVRTAYLESRSIAARGRDHHVSRAAIADLLPEYKADQDATAPELAAVLDLLSKFADFLRATELEPAERAAPDQGVTVRRGQFLPEPRFAW
ncbi:hypothetical protein OHT57_45985 [Streptomyces sp. NBC_00285]|uniref:hypothetical protein n=1 Tax=Streptomyces sp. NBC_00285 TaxID=2975700 RepID=UPI002E2C8F7C|nr:hypothetical protein [Streptomyces sp. NBC_00285]